MAGRWTRKVQFGDEGTAGTAVAATVMWSGNGVAQEERDMVTLDYADGSVVGNDDSYTSRVGGTIALDSTPASFEHLPLILEMGIKTVAGSADGGGSDYIYTYDLPELAAQTVKTATVEAGDGQQAKEMDYAFAEGFSITGAAAGPMMVSANLRGRQWTPTSFTSLTPDAVETILFGKGTLYIDTTYGNMGNTEKSSTLLGMAFNANTGLKPKYTANGDVEFDFIYQDKAEFTLDITFEYNATAVAGEAAWRAVTAQYIKLIWTGSDFGTGGTTYSAHTLIFNLYGKWTSFDPMQDADGNDIMTGHLKVLYDSANTFTGNIIVVNESADVWA